MSISPSKKHTKKGKRLLFKEFVKECRSENVAATRRSSYKKERFGKHKGD